MGILLWVTHCWGDFQNDWSPPALEFFEPIGILIFGMVVAAIWRNRQRAK